MRQVCWLVLLAACGVDAELYGGEIDWVADRVGEIRIEQALPGEALVWASLWPALDPPLVTVPPPMGTCVAMRGVGRDVSSLDAGRITLSAGPEQALGLVHDGVRYRRDELVPLSVEGGVVFSVEAEGGDLPAFEFDPALSMPREQVDIRLPGGVEEPATRDDLERVTWGPLTDPHAVTIVRVADRFGNEVWCTQRNQPRLDVDLESAAWSDLYEQGPLRIEVERRRSRRVTLPSGPVALETAFLDREVLLDADQEGTYYAF